ncbi:MAG TPA: PrgI family protein [Patescibacteria group bacterium]
MSEEKPSKIDIPESIESYRVTLFWGLTIKQIVLIFAATLFVGFGVFSLFSGDYFTMLGMLVMTSLILLGIVEIKGRNFYRYLLFIFSYYKTKPRVLIYNHYSTSGIATIQAKQLVYQKENNNKIFIIIFVFLIFSLLLLTLIGVNLYHVIHK